MSANRLATTTTSATLEKEVTLAVSLDAAVDDFPCSWELGSWHFPPVIQALNDLRIAMTSFCQTQKGEIVTIVTAIKIHIKRGCSLSATVSWYSQIDKVKLL